MFWLVRWSSCFFRAWNQSYKRTSKQISRYYQIRLQLPCFWTIICMAIQRDGRQWASKKKSRSIVNLQRNMGWSRISIEHYHRECNKNCWLHSRWWSKWFHYEPIQYSKRFSRTRKWWFFLPLLLLRVWLYCEKCFKR